MNILMLTNTFTPHVGGVARSVQGFTNAYRRLGHRVLVIAPIFEGTPATETDVVRLPAVQHFRGSDFSIPMPVPRRVVVALRSCAPQIVHSHHPFLLGDTALRVAATHDIPVVFTHHTMYEKYTHYVPGDSPRLKRFTVDLVTGYCNLCDAVIAPSETVAELLLQRGVEVPIEVIPTGVNTEIFSAGDGASFRKWAELPPDVFVVGHAGRLAPEKNPAFLAEAVARFLLLQDRAHFLVVGAGPSEPDIRKTFETYGLTSRLHMVGVLDWTALAGAYRAMDVFAFASQTETQGMVLTEAMTSGVPVVAIDAPGVREVVRDRENGRLLPYENVDTFVAALCWVASLPSDERRALECGVADTAAAFSMSRTADRALALYESLMGTKPRRKDIDTSLWTLTRRRLHEERKILGNIAHAFGDAVLSLHRTDKPIGGMR